MSSDTKISYIKVGPSFLHPYFLTTEYLYIDKEKYMIDDILTGYNTGLIKFNKYEGVHPDYPEFKVCMLKCFKWHSREVELALRKLNWKLTVSCGPKYTEFRDEIFNILKDNSDPC